MLATCMLGGVKEESSKLMSSSSLSKDNKLMEAVTNLEERVHEKNCSLREQIDNNAFFLRNLNENIDVIKKEFGKVKIQFENICASMAEEVKERIKEIKNDMRDSQAAVQNQIKGLQGDVEGIHKSLQAKLVVSSPKKIEEAPS